MNPFEKIEAKLDRLELLVTDIRLDIAGLKVKSGIWGVLGGVASGALILFAWLLGR